MTDRNVRDVLNRPVLTDKARRALGLPVDGRAVEIVMVPVLDLPMRDDEKDRRR